MDMIILSSRFKPVINIANLRKDSKTQSKILRSCRSFPIRFCSNRRRESSIWTIIFKEITRAAWFPMSTRTAIQELATCSILNWSNNTSEEAKAESTTARFPKLLAHPSATKDMKAIAASPAANLAKMVMTQAPLNWAAMRRSRQLHSIGFKAKSNLAQNIEI